MRRRREGRWAFVCLGLLLACASPARAGDQAGERAEAAAVRAEHAAERSEAAASRVDEAVQRLERVLERMEREQAARGRAKTPQK